MNEFDREYQKLESQIKDLCWILILNSEKISERVQKIYTKSSSILPHTRIGFVNKEFSLKEAELYFDVVINDNDAPILRFGLGMERSMGSGIDQFYNSTLQFSITKKSVNELLDKNDKFEIDDFKRILIDESTKLTNIAVSDNSVYDNNTKKASGKSYRLIISQSEEELKKYGGISYDDNYNEVLGVDYILLKVQTILEEHLI